MMPDWVIPVLTFVCGAVGGYSGASRKMIVIESKVNELCEWMKQQAIPKIASHNEDLIIHDVEIQQLMAKNSLPRASRQINR
jgi:hypothetical protein